MFLRTGIWTHLDHIPSEGSVPCKWENHEIKLKEQNRTNIIWGPCQLRELSIRKENISQLGGEKY